MKNFKNVFFYIGIMGMATMFIYWIVAKGERLETGRNVEVPNSVENDWNTFMFSITHGLQHPLAILLAQIITIILIARLFGFIFRKIRQPSVIGEIIAGIVLGPSLLGMYFPEFSEVLFPKASLGNLEFLSQIGLMLFMFVIGMELDLKVLENKAKEAVVVSHASIVIPFTLGMGLAYSIYNAFAPNGVAFLSFALFLGIAMSITAFPVLARIVQERGMHKTRLGTMVITCAAADDITAWCILAVVIAIVKAGSFVSSLYTIGLALLYVLFMLKAVRPFLKRVGDLHSTRESLGKPVVAIFFLTMVISAYITEIIGIHALFGAFMAGVIMPDITRFRSIFIEKIEDISVILLLPLFFVFTGLRTEIGLLNDPALWKVTGLIILVAVVGKFIGSALAAKYVGQSWKDSLIIGALMNTRGLMELIVLNIGYDLGVLTKEVFTMMVIMALVTTLMTGPALDLIDKLFKKKHLVISDQINNKVKYRILIFFEDPDRGKKLLKLAHGLVKKQTNDSVVTLMHLLSSNDIHSFNTEESEEANFAPILLESKKLNQKIITLFRVCNDIDSEIVEEVNQGVYDLLLIGLGQSIFQGTLLGRVLDYTTRIINPDLLIDKFKRKERLFENSPFDERTRQILLKSKKPVGILVDKNLKNINRLLMPVFSKEESFLIPYAEMLIKNNDTYLTVIDVMNEIQNNSEIEAILHSIEQEVPDHIIMSHERTMKKEFLEKQDLILISLDSWKKLLASQSIWLSNTPSVLIIKP